MFNTMNSLKHDAAAHGAVAIACILAQMDDDPSTPRLDARDANGATPLIRFVNDSKP
jgi:hypothetical protein